MNRRFPWTRRNIRGGAGGASVAAPTYVSINTAYGMWDGGSSRIVTYTGGVPTAVTVGGNAATITASDATTVTFTTPAASSESVDVVDVVIANSAGSSTGTGVFTYLSVQYAARQLSATLYSVHDAKWKTLNGGDVETITDRGNCGWDITQSNSSLRPLWEASAGPNSQPCVTATSGDYLVATTAAQASVLGCWWMAVYSSVTDATSGYIYGQFDGATPGPVIYHPTTTPTVYVHDGTSQKNDVAGTLLAASGFALVDGYITTSGSNLLTGAINGTPSGSPTALAAGTQGLGLTKAAMFAKSDGTVPRACKVAFAATIFANPTTAAFLTVERYFEERFGLTIATRAV